jgi:hypothetical protein
MDAHTPEILLPASRQNDVTRYSLRYVETLLPDNLFLKSVA